VAGTIGGSISGVAKNVTLVSVRVLGSDGSGSLASILSGIDYIMGQRKTATAPMVVNMSLGGMRSRQLNAAVTRLVEAGVVLVAAAGNRGISACVGSPGSSKAAITVGASTVSSWFGRDRRARFSNHGRCVDIFA
jgi:subtilisin family serine protease